jgi:tripartite-type tricarboxylate transporter receptor subunit TctC
MSATRRMVLSFLALSTLLPPAMAGGFPEKPIKLIVPSAAGGPTDIPARLVADLLGSLGQSVIVENRPGAAGAIGARAVAASAPDGHTLLVGNTSVFAVIPAVSASAGYDPRTAFTPVAKIAESYQILAVHPSSPWKSVRELVDYAKHNPGKLNYAHTGPGGLPHLATELFALNAGIDIVGVPYKSGGETVTALLGQQVQMEFQAIEILLPLIREGKLRALAITSPNRTPLAPELPTLSEVGIADYEVTTFQGIAAPAGTPTNIVEVLNAAINEGMKKKEVQDTIARLGAAPGVNSPQEFGRFIAMQYEKWSGVAQRARVRVD